MCEGFGCLLDGPRAASRLSENPWHLSAAACVADAFLTGNGEAPSSALAHAAAHCSLDPATATASDGSGDPGCATSFPSSCSLGVLWGLCNGPGLAFAAGRPRLCVGRDQSRARWLLSRLNIGTELVGEETSAMTCEGHQE